MALPPGSHGWIGSGFECREEADCECCEHQCQKCNDGSSLVCPKSLRVQFNTYGCSWDFNVNCFQRLGGVLPTAVVRNDIISTLTEQKYTEIVISIVVDLGIASIQLQLFQFWQYPGSPTMSQTNLFRFRQLVSGASISDCIYPQWSHFPCSVDNTNLSCNGSGVQPISTGPNWRLNYDFGVWPEPPICDLTALSPGFWNATLSWV